MKSIMRMRHYCDFCKKSGATKPRMAKHEKGCTKNPHRVCGLCAISGNVQEPMSVLRAVFAAEGFPALREKTEDCPACILAVLRQANDDDPAGEEGFWFGGWDDPKNKGRVEWNFKEEMKKFWADHNDSQDRGFF